MHHLSHVLKFSRNVPGAKFGVLQEISQTSTQKALDVLKQRYQQDAEQQQQDADEQRLRNSTEFDSHGGTSKYSTLGCPSPALIAPPSPSGSLYSDLFSDTTGE